jgi:hypothetical protein
VEPGNLAQWVGAGMTLAAVTVALFKEDILRLLRHPELEVRLEPRYPDCVKTAFAHDTWKGSRYWLRLWVANVGKVRAEKVEVYVAGASVEEGGSFVPLPQFTPMNLRWSYSPYNSPLIYVDGISPQMGRYCDFGAISEPTHPHLVSLPDPTRLGLQTEVGRPTAEWLPRGKYRFDLLIAASNCEPVKRVVELHLTGRWSEDETDMFTNCVIVKVH